MPQVFANPDMLADAILRKVGREIVLALPLGLGKANHVANALYVRASADRSIKLTIFTALTLEKPRYPNTLARRFLEPVIQRLFGSYPELAYARALREGSMPANISVNEFFFPAGQWLNVSAAQQNYISANYTHAARYVLERGVNVIAQLVSKREIAGASRFSLSCNTDLTLDLLDARHEGKADFLLIGQVNSELPFMPGPGDLAADAFHAVLDSPETDFPLFAPPKEPVDLAEYAIGFHIARTIADGGTLQIGIGQEGDAAVHAMLLRHRQNAVFRDAIARLSPGGPNDPFAEMAPFDIGLYAATEMFVDAFLALLDAGILKREVEGVLLHAAFFLGPKSFYRALREMDPQLLGKLQMTAVSFTNSLLGGEAAKKAARTKARFVNNAMMATLLGAVVSDGLEDGRVVSGVGGQFDFVSQAFALPDARSILTLKSFRSRRGRTESNIRWAYGHETVPRHFRDIVVTEYGIADLRGKSDQDVIAAMLAVADSRFQPELLAAAKRAGKIPSSCEIPAPYRNNTPQRIADALGPLHARGYLPAFPLGTDFDPVEQRLLPALELLEESSASPSRMARLLRLGLFSATMPGEAELLDRLSLHSPRSLADRILRAVVRAAITQTQA